MTRAHSTAHSEVPAIVHRVLRSQGRPLDKTARASIGSRFGHDFSNVRIHTNAEAARSAKAVNAAAYTVGNNIVFGDGQYAPETPQGHHLLAHELAHTMQQQAQTPQADTAGLRIASSRSPMEREAATAAAAASSGRPARIAMRGGPQLARQDADDAKKKGPPSKPVPAPPATTGKNRKFSLTFDDGPHALDPKKGKNLTKTVLDTLHKKGVKAGFFIQTGVSYRGANRIGRELVRRMHKEGHTVGIHTGGKKDHESHPSARKDGRLAGELSSAKKYIAKETKVTPSLVRPPYGRSGKPEQAIYKKLRLKNLLWDIDGDVGAKNLSKLKMRLSTGIAAVHARGWKGTTPAHPKIVVLYHDLRKPTANHIGDLIDHIRKVVTKISGGKDTVSFEAP